MPFELESNYTPRGDQGQAIAKLLKSIEAGDRHFVNIAAFQFVQE